MSISERIVYIQQQEGVSASKFADLLGVQRSGLSHIYSGRNKPSIDFLQKLTAQFPQYRVEWILNDIKPILKTSNKLQEGPEPDLFNQVRENQVKRENIAEYKLKNDTKELTRAENSDNNTPDINLERVLEKVMLIYSDNTFEILKPQNHK